MDKAPSEKKKLMDKSSLISFGVTNCLTNWFAFFDWEKKKSCCYGLIELPFFKKKTKLALL